MSYTQSGPRRSKQEVYNPSTALETLRRQVNDGRVYVINASDLEGKRAKGAVNIGVTMRNGETRNVVVPSTWIPIDLSQQMPREELLQSPSFLTNVMRRVILLVDLNTAEEMLSDSANADEQSRIYSEQMALFDPEAMLRDPGIPQNQQNARVAEDEDDDGNPTVEGVTARVQEAVGRDDLTAQQRFAIVRNMGETITSKDLQFILQNSDDQGLVDYAAGILERRGEMRPVSGPAQRG